MYTIYIDDICYIDYICRLGSPFGRLRESFWASWSSFWTSWKSFSASWKPFLAALGGWPAGGFGTLKMAVRFRGTLTQES